MRIRRLSIDHWRHFKEIELDVDDGAGLVCVVGANGTGKSHLLELLSACAHQLGLSQGIEIPRGNPFEDLHQFELIFYLAEGVSSSIDEGVRALPEYATWDRTLTIKSANTSGHHLTITAGGISDRSGAGQFAQRTVQLLRNSKDVHFLSLDADRAYPRKSFNSNQIAEAYEIEWEGAEYTRGRSYRPSSTLYDEWIKYFLAQENQSGTRLIRDIRRARQAGGDDPRFEDHFAPYRDALRHVLPHVVFAGVDSKRRTLLFDTTGLELRFDQLSGGEREIAFLLGQIDRFRLRNGLFLLDEPELHLNADLIRSWVAYLTGTVETGQIWLATHSLEAVEAAGQHATYILERNDEARHVNTVARLDSRPILSALSRAVGTPAFAISQLRFVFVEGEESVGERERFRRLAGAASDLRFMACGSGNEVLRRLDTITGLAEETDTGIRIGGIVDRDFKSAVQIQALESKGVHVLAVHEVENLFLHPETVRVLLAQTGKAAIDPRDLIRDASDARAGAWIFQFAYATEHARELPEVPERAKGFAKSLSWSQFVEDRASTIISILDTTAYGKEAREKLENVLEVSVRAYERKRAEADLWKNCEGKEVLSSVARSAGYNGVANVIDAALVVWDSDKAAVPVELGRLRTYLDSM